MRKGYYIFRECGSFSRVLLWISAACVVLPAILFFVSREWFGLVVLFAIPILTASIFVNVALHKLCRDVATLLKEIEDKK